MSRPVSPMKLFVMNSDSYLYTVEEAALLNRMNRRKFLDDYLNNGFEVIRRDRKIYIRHEELKKYQEQYARVLTSTLSA
jgi:hypothetical protein